MIDNWQIDQHGDAAARSRIELYQNCADMGLGEDT
jgi:hypothetical protein